MNTLFKVVVTLTLFLNFFFLLLRSEKESCHNKTIRVQVMKAVFAIGCIVNTVLFMILVWGA